MTAASASPTAGGPDGLRVRPMTLADVPDVAAIDRLSFSLPWPERSYRYELTENPAARLLVAEMPASPRLRVVGYVGLWLLVDEAHISTIAVHPAERGRGIGETLLLAALDLAARIGAELATLEVRASNAAAQNLYRKHGFEVVGSRPGYYKDNREDAVLMTLSQLRQRLPVAEASRGS
ncbi:MAG TPA: ribosomal protein S18-alanine N-acetyltransferase [Anaerolineales bacterium]|nr:ribosomal protein S18-alanine N-acetyltransferase [Anaerolineales bacterium]